jgi:hypothetical protein
VIFGSVLGSHSTVLGISLARPPLQRTQIIRYVTELPDHLGIAEVARSWITRAAKCDRAHVSLFARKRLSAHYDGLGIEAFRGFASRHTVIAGYERQSNVIRHFGHGSVLLLGERFRILKNACNDLLCGITSFLRHFWCHARQIVVIG